MSSTAVRFGLLLHHTSIKEVGKQMQHNAAYGEFTNLHTNWCFCQKIEWTECDP